MIPNLGITSTFNIDTAPSRFTTPQQTDPAASQLITTTEMLSAPRPLITPAPPDAFPLFELPGELRNIIYELSLQGDRDTPSLTDQGFGVPCPQILLAHPLAYYEAKDLLFVDKTFKFTLYHSTDCMLGDCRLPGCELRCVKADWSVNEGRRQDVVDVDVRVKYALPSWTSRIFSAYVEVLIDPISEPLVSRGNVLAALNSFLHILSLEAKKLEKLRIKFVVKGRSLLCPHLYSVLFPLTRCPALKEILLEDIPGREKIQRKLQRSLGRKISCPEFEKVRKTVEGAQRLLWRAQNQNVDRKTCRRMANRLHRPEYQFRTKCDLTWHAEQGAVVWSVPPRRTPDGRETVGMQRKMISLCKGETFYRRLGKADLGKLEGEMGLLRLAMRESEDDVWSCAVDSGVDMPL
ncbi:hypothetical protein M409DRAFT_15843 [Zasmidium cellare ATCC 36951]|uniref:Uncharacterized protein n=1 Tax=Zasmidium cellare ATCC 36951 TaxID=1080233 RepID=A0A6A6D372_ZASCE|nr:uncharacterized protein M409DRAFT_15843 [Zasmidium cellare ATCC 36951]KAF2173563.1 hypothetical protein M409DRAFT_15843 [Zasmidium cellare ATCC 36951]